MATAAPAFSVVIPSYRMAATLTRCLSALGDQLAAARARAHDLERPFEVVVVDSSNDGSVADLQAQFPDVTFVVLPTRTLAGAARNLGATHADGRSAALAFLDADCVPGPEWARAVRDVLAAGVDVAAGPVTPRRPVTPRGPAPPGVATLAALLLFLVEFAEFLPRRGARARNVRFAPSCNLVVHRDVWRQVGGFPEELAGGEDLAWAARLREFGHTVRLDPLLEVGHVGRSRPSEVVAHLFGLGVWSARARMHTPALPGAFLTHAPWRWLLAFVVPARAVRIVARVALAPPRFLWLLLVAISLSPLLLLALVVWAAGFMHGARR